VLRSPSHLAVVPLVLLVGVGLTGCSSGSSKKDVIRAPTQTQAAVPTTDSTTAPPTTPETGASTTASVKIVSFAYDPTPLTVAPGTTIPVTNTDSAEHTVTSDLAGLFTADDIKNGKTVTFKAPTRPGKYQYHCQYHARMHGTLIVT
jgi:plastocyanin